MKKITLLLMFLMSLTGWSQISIGTGTDQLQSLPFDPYYGYTYGQSIYLASEIGATGTITGIQWYFSGNAGATIPNSQGLTVYIGHTAKSTFASTTDWEPVAGLTQVYTGGVTANGPGWVTITFTTPFVYNGTSNLLIAVDENMAGFDTSNDDFYNTSAANRSIYYRSDTTNPDPAAPPTGVRASFVPNITLQGISVSTPPSCTTLSNPANAAVNVMSGQITWTAATGSPTGYKLNVGTTPGGTQVLNMMDVGNVTTYNLGTLTPGISYYVKVTPYNGNGDAAGCTETSFTTCGTITAPATENFATFLPGCWQEADNGDLTAGPATFGAGDWAADGYLNSGTTGAIKVNVYSNVKNDWVLSPMFSIPATGYELKFDAAVTQWNGAGAPTTPWEADDYVQVLVSTGLTNWTVLHTFTDANIPSNLGGATILDLDAYAGQNVRFAFRVVEGTADGGADVDFFVDNFEIRVSPSCAEPTGLAVSNVTDGAAVVNWNATTGNYQYVLDNVATDPAGSGTTLAGETYNASPLLASTTYYFHVRTVCAGPIYSTWSTVSFTTLATPPANDNCTGAATLTLGALFADNDVPVNLAGATNSNPPDPTCALFSGNDVWYRVTVPASGSFTVETNNDGSGNFDTGLAVYSGDCASLVLVECDDDDSADGNYSLVALTGRTPGEVLYVNTWRYSGGAAITYLISAYDASLNTGSFDAAGFNAYPNPVKDVLNLSHSTEMSSVEVYNVLGQKVLVKELNAAQAQINLSALNAGNYIVKVTANGATKSIKVIKI
ncbi:T9SS type A sorting domain-containing protein [Flavobacterium pedocola]